MEQLQQEIDSTSGILMEVGHNHKHDYSKISNSRLWIVFFTTFAFMILEGVVGYSINSLALLADAGHMLNDVVSILLAILAIRVGKLATNKDFTFGYRRVEVVSGLINGISLLAISLYIISEGITRFVNNDFKEIQGNLLLITAFFGLIINIVGMMLLRKESETSINIDGAYQHLIADMLGSAAAIIAGLSIIIWKAFWMDLVVSIIISLLILKSGISITLRAGRIILQATPKGKDIDNVLIDLKEIPGVINVHDLHGWTVTDGQDLISGHVLVEKGTDTCAVLTMVKAIVSKHGYTHPTFQIEFHICDQQDLCYPKST